METHETAASLAGTAAPLCGDAMTRDALPVAVAMLALLALSVALATSLFRAESSSTPPVPSASPVTAAPSPSMRCTNGDPPRVWTQVEAETRYHTASMWLRSAESAGVWSDRGRRALGLATSQFLEILLCTQGVQP
jgi:hypothetical protein